MIDVCVTIVTHYCVVEHLNTSELLVIYEDICSRYIYTLIDTFRWFKYPTTQYCVTRHIVMKECHLEIGTEE